MNRFLLLLTVSALLLGASGAVADVAPWPLSSWGRGPNGGPPRPRLPSHAVPFVIEPGDGPEAKLIVPRARLAFAKQVAQANPDQGRTPPLFAGAALLTCGGLALASRRRAARALFLTLLLSGALFAGHAGLRATPPLRPQPICLSEARLQGMSVEITEEGDTIRLILPRAKFADLARTFPAR